MRAQASRFPSDVKFEPVMPWAERRRSPRWKAHIPVFVYGYGPAAQPFHEQAYSAVVSETGGLLVMTESVGADQPLLVTNKFTGEEQECRVARVGGHDAGSLAVAVEFAQPESAFWRVTPEKSPKAASGATQEGRTS